MKKLTVREVSGDQLSFAEKAAVLAGADPKCNVEACLPGCILPEESYSSNYKDIDKE